MSLTKKQIDEYREKLGNSRYMEIAINEIAERLSSGHATVKPPYAEPEINNTKGKRR
jgi:hypothetical protein